MPRARDPSREKAFQIYKEHNGNIDLVEIASHLNISPGTIRGWKSKDKWEQLLNGTLPKKGSERSKRKRGGQPGNKNATGPPGNKHAEKYGFFDKYLPDETKEIFDAISQANPLDLLWHQIQIAYAAIVRAQRIAYVKDQQDMTKEEQMTSFSDKGGAVAYEIQQAWDKQENFLKAQARAQSELRSMIKQYDEMLHKDWELATDEQKARIEVLKAKSQVNESVETEGDGFINALDGKVDDVWQEE